MFDWTARNYGKRVHTRTRSEHLASTSQERYQRTSYDYFEISIMYFSK